MADITVTAANVRPVSGATQTTVVAGETITAGQPVYKKAADSKYYKAISNSSEASTCRGIAITNAGADEQLVILSAGKIIIGGTVVLGESYFVSGTAGGIQPSGDVGSGEYVCFLGIGVTTTQIKVNIDASGIAHA